MKGFSVAIIATILCASAVFAADEVQPGNYLTFFLTGKPFANNEIPNVGWFVETIGCTTTSINESLSGTEFSGVFEQYERGLNEAAENIVKCEDLEQDEIASCAWEQIDAASDRISKFVLDLLHKDVQLLLSTLQTLKKTCGRQN